MHEGSNLIDLKIGDSLAFTLEHARAGDVIELSRGCHPAPKGLALDASGTPEAWIVIRGKKGTRPTIALSGGELRVSGSYVLLENVDVIGGWGNNIHVVPSSVGKPVTNVILRDVRSADMGRGTGAALKVAGLWSNGHGAKCEQVYVEGCELTGSRDNALLDAVGVRRSVVRGSWLHDPMNLSMKSPGVFFKGGSSDILIEGNLVSGIRGNAAIMVGGDTGAKWFDALHAKPLVEGVNQVIRNNLVADFDDAGIECRGAQGVKILANTIVTRSSFAIFRLHWGGAGSGARIGNRDIEIANNLVVGSGGAKGVLNDANEDANLVVGRQLWAGRVVDATCVPSEGVLAKPSDERLRGLADALARFAPAPGSPALGAAVARDDVPCDARGAPRPRPPAFGAVDGR